MARFYFYSFKTTFFTSLFSASAQEKFLVGKSSFSWWLDTGPLSMLPLLPRPSCSSPWPGPSWPAGPPLQWWGTAWACPPAEHATPAGDPPAGLALKKMRRKYEFEIWYNFQNWLFYHFFRQWLFKVGVFKKEKLVTFQRIFKAPTSRFS